MKYKEIVIGKFVDRPNRFIAHVDLDGKIETVHVKNTGRCKELLLPGVRVVLEKSDNMLRKTKFDLVTVTKENRGLINIDSQAPNKIVAEWLKDCDFDYVKAEKSYGESRIDFYMEKGQDKYLMEVKGCTLERDGYGYFPDAPTQRGVKHLKELIKASREGYICYITFVIQMNNIYEVFANEEIDIEFAKTFEEAKKAGVKVVFLCCDVSDDEVKYVKTIGFDRS